MHTNPLFIPIHIPEGALEGPAKEYWKLVVEHGPSRENMVNFICGIGGYSTRVSRYAIEFDVKAHYARLDADHLWKVLNEHCDAGPEKDWTPERTEAARALFVQAHDDNADHLFDWGLEEARECWEDSDIPFETFTGDRVDWKWTFEGRGGGHLCMTECEGIEELQCTPEELEKDLKQRWDIGGYVDDIPGDYVVLDETIRKLFIICVQNFVDLTPRKISDEVEYQAAFRLWTSFVEPELEKAEEKREMLSNLAEKKKRLGEAAMGILSMLEDMRADGSTYADSFKEICELAGVSYTEEPKT